MTQQSLIQETSEWIEKYQPLSVPPIAKWAEQFQSVFLVIDSCFESLELAELCRQFLETHLENKSTALIIARSARETMDLTIPIHTCLIQINNSQNPTDFFKLLASVHALILPNLREEIQSEALAALLMNRPVLLYQIPQTQYDWGEGLLIPTQIGFKGLLNSFISRRELLRPRQLLLDVPNLKAAVFASGLLAYFPNRPDLETIEAYMNAGYFEQAGVLAVTLLRNLHWLNEEWQPEKGLKIMKACLLGKKYFEAIKIGRKILSFMPENSALALYLAVAFWGIKDFIQAQLFLERSLSAEDKTETKKEFENIILVDELNIKINKSISKCLELPIIIFNPISRLSASHFIAQTLSQSLSLPLVHLSTGLEIGTSNTLHFERTAELIYKKQGALAFDRWPATETNHYFLLKFFKSMVVHVRDPRSILVSLGIYLHHLLELDKKAELPTQFQRSLKLIHWDLRLRSFSAMVPGPKQIEYGLESGLFQAYLNEILAWLELEKTFPSSFKILITSYEQLIKNQASYFKQIIDFYQINPDFFDYQVESINSLNSVFGPTPNPDSPHYFFRRGDPNEWTQFVSESQKKQMTNAIPNALFERFEWDPAPR
ncbi:MAG: sulfotransferase domain-containing protein [Candidatus Sericytochromatia bacterium]|nr:sulfotransferase domain-containing protein [Candidatus Sericytochromatia bacterium]